MRIRKRYSRLIAFLLSGTELRILKDEYQEVVIGKDTPDNTITYRIFEKYRSLFIEWKVRDTVFGNYKSSWEFDVGYPQDLMIQKLSLDMQRFQKQFSEKSPMDHIPADSIKPEEKLSLWDAMKKGPDADPSFVEIIDEFLIPYKIDPFKWLANLKVWEKDDFWDDLDNPNLSASLVKFLKDGMHWTVKVYPNWFVAGFPDVVFFYYKGGFSKELDAYFESKDESQLVDQDGFLLDEPLHRMINDYLKGHSLEVSYSKF